MKGLKSPIVLVSTKECKKRRVLQQKVAEYNLKKEELPDPIFRRNRLTGEIFHY